MHRRTHGITTCAVVVAVTLWLSQSRHHHQLSRSKNYDSANRYHHHLERRHAARLRCKGHPAIVLRLRGGETNVDEQMGDLSIEGGGDVNTNATSNLSKNARKKMLRMERLQKAREEKALLREQKAANESAQQSSNLEESLSPNMYYDMRKATVSRLKASGVEPYPHKFNITMSLQQFARSYQSLSNGARLNSTELVAARVTGIRKSSKNLYFIDIEASPGHLQVISDRRIYNSSSEQEFDDDHHAVHRGDIIGVEGYPGKSKRGELSVFPRKIQILSRCLHMLPKSYVGMTDTESRYRMRYLDLIVNPHVNTIFRTRAKIIQFIRRYLEDRGFLEVETPMMTTSHGGASAKPFITHHNELDRDLYLRVAPELFLKQLVIGGLEKVFEIGRNFRNEGIDLTHNPEFTACEFYQAYADYDDLMATTEHMLSELVKSLTGSYKINCSIPTTGGNDGDEGAADNEEGEGGGTNNVSAASKKATTTAATTSSSSTVEIDFTPPFRRIRMIPELERQTGRRFPTDYTSKEAHSFLSSLCDEYNVTCHPPKTPARMLDKLVGRLLEKGCMNPSFITDHPAVLSPLAKHHRQHAGLTERFELFVCGKEIANAYTELNDPEVQRERFMAQAEAATQGDEEAQMLDETFCTALEYGLPPTAGWGLGIDRLVMMLTSQHSLREVLFFPAMRAS